VILLLRKAGISAMIPAMTTQQLQQRLAKIKAELLGLGPIHPGSLSEQYNVCGTPGCRCKDPKKPEKHGPYAHLSYTWRGNSSTRFVRPNRVHALREKIANYKRFRELAAEWVDVAMALDVLEREAAKQNK
jgi:hypothetical protein